MPKVLIILSILVIGGCSLVVFNVAICLPEIPSTMVAKQSLSELLDKSDPTAEDLIYFAQTTVQQNISPIANAHILAPSISFLCTGSDCQLDGLSVNILAVRPVCWREPWSGYRSDTIWEFNISENYVEAATSSAIYLNPPPVSFSDVEVGIDDARRIAFDEINPEFVQENEFRFTLTLYRGHWQAKFNKDIEGKKSADIEIQIDYSTGEIIPSSELP